MTYKQARLAIIDEAYKQGLHITPAQVREAARKMIDDFREHERKQELAPDFSPEAVEKMLSESEIPAEPGADSSPTPPEAEKETEL